MPRYNGHRNAATYHAYLYLNNDGPAYKQLTDSFLAGEFCAASIERIFKKNCMALDPWMLEEGAVDWEEMHQDYLEVFAEANLSPPVMPENERDVLSNAAIEGNVVKLGKQLDRKLYEQVAKVLNALGGKWNRPAGGFVFKEDPSELIETVVLTGIVQKVKKFQFGFVPTPPPLGEPVVELAEIKEGMTVLEPSAGSANLAKIITKYTAIENVQCFELQESNFEILRELGFKTSLDDFLSIPPTPTFDRVVMNPPFEKLQDIKHVQHAWEFVKPGGRLVAIMSPSFTFRDQKLCTNFRDFVEEFGYYRENPAGSFKASGTSVNTVTVVLNKPHDYVSSVVADAETLAAVSSLEDPDFSRADLGLSEVQMEELRRHKISRAAYSQARYNRMSHQAAIEKLMPATVRAQLKVAQTAAPAPSQGRLLYYGGSKPITRVDSNHLNEHTGFLCTFASVARARNYGDVITAFELKPTAQVAQISLEQWLSGETDLKAIHADGIDAVVVKESSNSTNDMVFALSADAFICLSSLNLEEVEAKTAECASSLPPKALSPKVVPLPEKKKPQKKEDPKWENLAFNF